MWEWKPGGPEARLQVFTDKTGEVVGYRALGTDWERPCAHEVGVVNDEACDAVFGSLLEAAKERRSKELPCIVHPDHPFCRFAFWQRGEIRIRSGGGAGMTRVLDLVSLLTKVSKELERRLDHSEFYRSKLTLKISSDEGLASLEINQGQVFVSPDDVHGRYQLDIPLACLNPLITGYKGIRELLKNPDVSLKGGKHALRLIEVLFPTGFPFGGFPPLVWE